MSDLFVAVVHEILLGPEFGAVSRQSEDGLLLFHGEDRARRKAIDEKLKVMV